MDEQLRDLTTTAQMDQALAGFANLARMFRAYYLSLIDEGFSEGDALAMTIAGQGVVLRKETGRRD